MASDDETKPPQPPGPATEEMEPGVLGASSPRLTRSVQAQIGERLRMFYETLQLGEEPVPERFIEIIGRLDEAPQETRS
jgi:hypothetical protein